MCGTQAVNLLFEPAEWGDWSPCSNLRGGGEMAGVGFEPTTYGL
jgi:hypothetical protein